MRIKSLFLDNLKKSIVKSGGYGFADLAGKYGIDVSGFDVSGGTKPKKTDYKSIFTILAPVVLLCVLLFYLIKK